MAYLDDNVIVDLIASKRSLDDEALPLFGDLPLRLPMPLHLSPKGSHARANPVSRSPAHF